MHDCAICSGSHLVSATCVDPGDSLKHLPKHSPVLIPEHMWTHSVFPAAGAAWSSIRRTTPTARAKCAEWIRRATKSWSKRSKKKRQMCASRARPPPPQLCPAH